MHKVDGPGASPTGTFVELDPILGIQATQVTADIANAFQAEIIAVIEDVGLTLNKADNTQLLQAVRTHASRAAAFKNKLINGDMRIWQRDGAAGPTVGTSAKYFADQWLGIAGTTAGSALVSREAHVLGQTDVPNNPEFLLKWNQTIAGAGAIGPSFQQYIEDVATLSGGQITVSWYAWVDSGTLTMKPTMRQDFGTGGSADVSVAGTVESVTTIKQRFTQQFTLASISGKTVGVKDYLGCLFDLEQGKTFTLHVSDIQVEAGGSVSEYERLTFEIQVMRCRRYLYKSWAIDAALFTITPSNAGMLTAIHDKAIGDPIWGIGSFYPVEMYPDATGGAAGCIWYANDGSGTAGRLVYGSDTSEIVISNFDKELNHTGHPTLSVPAGADAGFVGVLAHFATKKEIPS